MWQKGDMPIPVTMLCHCVLQHALPAPTAQLVQHRECQRQRVSGTGVGARCWRPFHSRPRCLGSFSYDRTSEEAQDEEKVAVSF